MIGLFVIEPLPFIYIIIGGLRRWQKSEIADNPAVVFNRESAILFHIGSDDSLRRIALFPLVHIARKPHNPFCSLHDLHDFSHVGQSCLSDGSAHVSLLVGASRPATCRLEHLLLFLLFYYCCKYNKKKRKSIFIIRKNATILSFFCSLNRAET